MELLEWQVDSGDGKEGFFQNGETQKNTKRRRVMLQHELRRTAGVEDLPYDILVEILSRLPLKSLVIIKLTCRLWNGIINDSWLAEVHRDRAIDNPGLLYVCRPEWGREPIICFAENIGGQIEGTKIGFDDLSNLPGAIGPRPLLDRTPRAQIHASSGGLMVFFTPEKYSFYVCNPILKETVEVPLKLERTAGEIWWGFGFSPWTREYKIVHLSYPSHWTRTSSSRKVACHIYTFGSSTSSQTWKRIRHRPKMHAPWINHYYVDCNGTLFWTIRQGRWVLSFDTVSEKFETLKGPPQLLMAETKRGGKRARQIFPGTRARMIRMEDTVGVVWSDPSRGILLYAD